MDKIAIVILNWNGEAMLRKFLPGVIAHSEPVGTVYVADNGSTDNSIDLLNKEFPTVRQILFDKNYGFAEGYNMALKEIDEKLDIVYKNLQSDDLLLITADHGCDPTTPSTDHSREYVPLLILGEKIGPKNLGTVRGFDCIADLIAVRYGLQKNSELYQKLSGGAK